METVNIKFSDIDSTALLTSYYQERLGSSFDNPPCLAINPDVYVQMIMPGGLLRRLKEEEPSADEEIIVIDSRGLDGTYHLYLAIDQPQTGSLALLFFKQTAITDLEKAFIQAFMDLANQSQKLVVINS